MYDESMDYQPGLRLPLQAAPIDRTPTGAAAFSSEAGVNASFDWGGLLSSVAGAALPMLASAI
jgi:hypothetical protein